MQFTCHTRLMALILRYFYDNRKETKARLQHSKMVLLSKHDEQEKKEVTVPGDGRWLQNEKANILKKKKKKMETLEPPSGSQDKESQDD